MTTSTKYTDARPTRQRTARRKAVLFCRECGYESPVTENWLEVATPATRTFVCPVCGTVVDRRATRTESAPAEAD